MKIFRKESIPFLVIVILAAATLVLTGQCYIQRQNLIISENTVKTLQYDQKVLNFTKLFITKVLKADGEVSFEDRLKLENMVRTINNKTIFDQWQKFVNAKNAVEAQIEVKNLLELLANSINL